MAFPLRSLVLACFLALASAFAAEPPPLMYLSEVKVGMKGTGRTVFQGGKIDTFQFEVLGILRNVVPGRSYILIRASGGPLAQTGILAGMSGSPCYIDGKLIGAVAIGWGFEKEPIGGVTPIGEMMEGLKDLNETPAARTPLILPKLEPPKVLKSALSGRMVPMSEILGPMDLPDGAQPLPLPVSGASPSPEFAPFWQGLPMRPVAVPGGAASGGEASPMEPGGMVAMNLVQGDLNISAAGTITYVSGKRLYALGHQYFNLGSVDMPLWSATVATCLPNWNESFKVATPVAPVGALRLDRSMGVAGLLGAEARTIPMRLGLNLGGKRALNLRFELMDHPLLTPNLAAVTLSQSLSAHVKGQGFQSLSLQGNIKLAGQTPIEIECMVADLNGNRLALYLGGILQVLTMNPWERPVVEGISLNVKAEERLDLTAVAGVRTLKARVKRGSTLPVYVMLQNIQGTRESVVMNLFVPPSARPGKATLLVGDGFSLIQADPDERAIDLGGLGDLVRMLNGGMKNNHAYALLVQAQPGAGLRGARIEGVPPTISAMLGADGDFNANRLQRQIVSRTVLPLETEVRGLVTMELEVE
ncbi:MAG TPA: SpoIVB peptidase S55 domain-containing protein [Holophaga sp.]|nr:SpoIVB peptidase S55 domain-containing protein [Holophaga sp.]